MAIFAHLEEPWEGLPSTYRYALISAAQSLQLREAIPFLLGEFRRGGNSATSAARAMDSIRAYHDRLQAFEAYADGREDVRSAELERLLGLLEDEDAELRRAAVLALAAMRRTDALPRILVLAKDDPDDRVRQAALDAVETMAR
jgi:HEAT repeat protein